MTLKDHGFDRKQRDYAAETVQNVAGIPDCTRHAQSTAAGNLDVSLNIDHRIAVHDLVGAVEHEEDGAGSGNLDSAGATGLQCSASDGACFQRDDRAGVSRDDSRIGNVLSIASVLSIDCEVASSGCFHQARIAERTLEDQRIEGTGCINDPQLFVIQRQIAGHSYGSGPRDGVVDVVEGRCESSLYVQGVN